MKQLHSNVPGLDSLLNGGLVAGRMYLIRGEPGVGKSLLGAHFLRGGLDNGEQVLYIHGEESRDGIVENLQQIGIDLSEADFLDLGPDTDFFTKGDSYSVVDPADIEAEEVTTDIQQTIEDIGPNRILFDPITQLEYIETDNYQYRKRLLSLLRFLRDQNMTVLATRTTHFGESSGFESADNVASISDGIIDLYRGEGGRRIKVPKHRGMGQSDRTHGLEIRESGIEVYPKLIPNENNPSFDPQLHSTTHSKLDSLLAGGIESDSVTFLSGPTGIGKSTFGAQFLTALAQNDSTVGAYLFEESVDQFVFRGRNLGYPLRELERDNRLLLTEVEPLEMSAEEFGQLVMTEVRDSGLEAVLIDGVDGYQMSLQGDQQRLIRRLHALTRSLNQTGVTVFITNEIDQIMGVQSATDINASYIADNILYLTYVPGESGFDRVFGVLKKRYGEFDPRFHYFTLGSETGIELGPPVDDMRGVVD